MREILNSLTSKNVITEEQSEQYLRNSNTVQELIQEIVHDTGVAEEAIFQNYANHVRLEYVDTTDITVSNEILMLLPPDFCRKNSVLPIGSTGGYLFLATSDHSNFAILDDVSSMTGKIVAPKIVPPTMLAATIDRFLRSDDELSALSEEIGADSVFVEEEEVDEEDDDAPIVRFVNLLIAQAIQDRASDIHVEPGANKLRVRFRIDGVLHETQKADKSIQAGVISRIKILSDIDIAEKRKPQDGRMSIPYHGKKIDIRVASLPTVWGEKIIMRILDHDTKKRSLEDMGMSEKDLHVFKKVANKPHGMVLVTGPTGSGKALALSTKIPTIDGMKTMETIDINDTVFGSDGKPYKVKKVHDIIDKPELYRVNFADGQSIIADADHQWLASTAFSRQNSIICSLQEEDDRYTREQEINRISDHLKTILEKVKETRMTVQEIHDTFLLPLNTYQPHEFETNENTETMISWNPTIFDIRNTLIKKECYAEQGTRLKEYKNKNIDGQWEVIVAEFDVQQAIAIIIDDLCENHSFNNTLMKKVSTKKMLVDNVHSESIGFNYAVPVNKPVQYNQEESIIDAYHTGALLAYNEISFDENLLFLNMKQKESLIQGYVENKSISHKGISHSVQVEDTEQFKGLIRIMRSLGITVNKNDNTITFDLMVSENQQWNYIQSIDSIDEFDDDYEKARCIEVDSPDHTYLCGDGYIVTGNSTSLYTVLDEVSTDAVNVITVEDPVEKRIEGINQVQINNQAGLTFPSALRSILRSDPDIVLIGEIRDKETATIAVEASLTGHLVLSTLHTNSAAAALTRLIEMDVEPYLVSTSVSAVVAQRLSRRLCEKCKELEEVDQKMLEDVEFPTLEDGSYPKELYRPVGCNACSGTGYKGRIAVVEVMEVTEEIGRMTVDNAPLSLIEAEARKHGFTSKKEDGFRHVLAGSTTIEEILRIVA